MDKRQLEIAWGETSVPVIAFETPSLRPVYENSPASQLIRGNLPAALPAQDAGTLAMALKGQEEAPVFLHLGSRVYSAAIVPQGEHLLCILSDATSYYNRTQSALDEAILASKAKTSFLSEMSHDIRTPMGAIVGLTEIALSQPDPPQKIKECLEKIQVASGHMMSLLNEVLDMSRIESGRVQIQVEQANIADLLHELLIVAKPQADSKHLDFQLEMGSMVCENLVLDPVRVKQICLNLLSNAIKYTPQGGWVEFYFAISAHEDPEKARMDLRVKDNGIGMSREFLLKLFSPFEREEKASVNKIQGTGLGMAITKSLIDLMGGKIAVESEPDKGSCFTVSIPFPRAECPEDFSKDLAGQKILLLDSDEKQAELTMQMLKDLGLEADWAQDADSAVMYLNDAELSGEAYYAFLTVEKLPDAEVTLLLPEIRHRMGSRLPILLLTANDWSQIEYVFTRSGVDGFIPLPMFRSRLAAGLSAYAQGPVPQQPEPEVRCDLTGRRLLLAEDNELNREIAQELIGEAGAEIDCAEDGKQAVEAFQASAPGWYDAILMDIQMPVMNGLDAAREIRRLDRPDARSVPIIAMTANAFVEDVKNSLEAGMNAHISKPLDMDRVFSTIEGLLRGRQP